MMYRFGAVALQLFLISACVVQPAPPPPEPPVTDPDPPEPGPRTIVLQDGTYVEIAPGIEPGFHHCCGDSEFMMEVDCSDRLMRCYQRRGRRWKQTYGKYCKTALEEGCYLHTCHDVCDAISAVGDFH